MKTTAWWIRTILAHFQISAVITRFSIVSTWTEAQTLTAAHFTRIKRTRYDSNLELKFVNRKNWETTETIETSNAGAALWSVLRVALVLLLAASNDSFTLESSALSLRSILKFHVFSGVQAAGAQLKLSSFAAQGQRGLNEEKAFRWR